jgi:predicted nuclease with TOPRIM domain
MKRPRDISTKVSKLKDHDQEVYFYIQELEKENMNLQKEKARLQVQIVSQQHEIEALKKAQKKPQEIIWTLKDE